METAAADHHRGQPAALSGIEGAAMLGEDDSVLVVEGADRSRSSAGVARGAMGVVCSDSEQTPWQDRRSGGNCGVDGDGAEAGEVGGGGGVCAELHWREARQERCWHDVPVAGASAGGAQVATVLENRSFGLPVVALLHEMVMISRE